MAINNAVSVLSVKRNSDLEAYLKNCGYQLNEATFKDDLNRIANYSQTILLKIEKQNSLLEKEAEKEKSNLSFEDVLIGYMSILGFGFKDSNTITLLEYLALEKQVKNKASQYGKS